MLSCTQMSLGHLSALLSWVSWVNSVPSAGPSGESQGCSTHHHRLEECHDLVLPPGLEQC